MAPVVTDRPAKQGGAPASTREDVVETAVEVGMILSKSQLFKKRPPKARDFVVPGMGSVSMASLTGGQQKEIWNRHEKEGVLRATIGFMAEVIAACLVDVDGKRMFDDLEDGAKQVLTLDLPVVQNLFNHAAHVSAMLAEAREELGKGSGPTPDGAG